MSKDEVLAAIDSSWRALKSAVESTTAAEVAAVPPGGGGSIADVLAHVSSSEAVLTRALLGNDGLHGDAAISATSGSPSAEPNSPVAELITELDETHRALRLELGNAPEMAFERGSGLRDAIDQATTLNYYEHNVEIRRLTEDIRSQAES